jgi:hypothetical protein
MAEAADGSAAETLKVFQVTCLTRFFFFLYLETGHFFF